MKTFIVFLVSVVLAMMAVPTTTNAQDNQIVIEMKALDQYIQLLETITPSQVVFEEGGRDGLISGSRFFQGDVIVSLNEYYLPQDSVHFTINMTVRDKEVYHILIHVDNIVVAYFPLGKLSITNLETGEGYNKVPERCWFVLHAIVNGDCTIKPWK
ncbi:MAG: hypothetical protein WC603_01990 [Candidatus Paceibacterota bacterium]|jgi:hypothetical protein